jgi:hypothetical protein
MATIDEPNNAMIRLNALVRNTDDPDDNGALADMGSEVLRVYNECAAFTRRTGKACKGQVTVIFDLKASKSEKETEVDVSIQPIKTKSPPKTLPRKKRTWAGHDGEISTIPVQEDLPLMGIKGAVEGGNKDAGKPAVKVV